MVDSVSVRFKNASMLKDAFKHSYAVECGNRLRVGVRAKNASVSGFACRSFQGQRQASESTVCSRRIRPRQRTEICNFGKSSLDFEEFSPVDVFWEGDEDSNFSVSESGGSVNGPILFTELPFL